MRRSLPDPISLFHLSLSLLLAQFQSQSPSVHPYHPPKTIAPPQPQHPHSSSSLYPLYHASSPSQYRPPTSQIQNRSNKVSSQFESSLQHGHSHDISTADLYLLRRAGDGGISRRTRRARVVLVFLVETRRESEDWRGRRRR